MMDVWMEDHNHSIREMMTRIGEIAWEELTNDGGLSYGKIIDEAFEIFEEEQGFGTTSRKRTHKIDKF